MLRRPWHRISEVSPVARSLAYRLAARRAVRSPAYAIIPYRQITPAIPSTPSSSPITAGLRLAILRRVLLLLPPPWLQHIVQHHVAAASVA